MADITQIDKKKVGQILNQEMIVPVDMETVKDKSTYDKNLYNVGAKEKENAFIDKLFSIEGVEREINSKTRNRLKNVQERNMSHLLLNDHKLGGDSDYMKDVKERVANLEAKLSGKSMEKAVLDELPGAFDRAISACEFYINHKNPWFPTGIRRKKKVRERLERLKEEKACFLWGRDAMEQGILLGKQKTPADLIIAGRNQEARIGKEMATFKKRYNKIKGIEEDVPKELEGEKTGFLSPVLFTAIQKNKQENEFAVKDMKYDGIDKPETYFYTKNLDTIAEFKKRVESAVSKNPAGKKIARLIEKNFIEIIQLGDMYEFMENVFKNKDESNYEKQYGSLYPLRALADAYTQYTKEGADEGTINELKGILQTLERKDVMYDDPDERILPSNLVMEYNKAIAGE
jgi:hypothetical protein